MTEAAVKLYRFQHTWIADKSRFKIGCMSRQIGKSFCTSLEVVDNVEETANDWLMLSRGERQSKELMEKVVMHCKAYRMGASDIDASEYKAEDSDNKYTMLTIYHNNGARIIGLPANPDTARGFTANTVLDEFGLHKDSQKIFGALFPSVSRGFKIRVISTPMGKSNKFYTLFTGKDNGWSKHFTDIYQAVEDGCPHDIEELRRGLDDEELWQQEYECQFLDEATAYLTYEMIASAESDLASEAWTPDQIKPGSEFFFGADIGRKRDLTVFWVIEKLGDTYITRIVECMEKTPFHIQHKYISDQVKKYNISRGCIDSSGLGTQLAEDLIRDLGSYRVEAVNFTGAIKNDLAVRTRRTFEDKRIRIPVSTKIRNDLHSVKKTVTAAGNIRFDAERTKDGHADRFWALALALMATDEGAIKPEIFYV